MSHRRLTDEQINQLADQIAGYMGWRVAWYLFRYPLIFLAGMWFTVFLDWLVGRLP